MEKIKYFKTTRILVIVGIAIIVILLILRITLPSIVRHIVEQKLSEKLGVHATIGNVDLGMLRGSVTMRQITIDNPSGFDSKPFLTIQKVFVNIALTSLLSKEVHIELVDINHLTLGIQRAREGSLNLKPILAHVKSAPTPSTEKPPSQVKSAGKKTGTGIFLKHLHADDVQISFEDYAVSEPPLSTELTFALSLKSFRYPDTSEGTDGEINITGELISTMRSPFVIRSTFKPFEAPPATIVSDTLEKYENIYLPHFNPYVSRYGFLFTSGLLTITYQGKTAHGQIEGLANLQFEDVEFKETRFKLSTLILGIPLHTFPQLFQGTEKKLELDLEVSGDIRNPQVSWSKLSRQLLIKTLGNAFRIGTIPIRKPFELIFEGVTKVGKEGSILSKFKDLLNPQTPDEQKEEPQEGEQKMKLEDFFGKKFIDQLKKKEKDTKD